MTRRFPKMRPHRPGTSIPGDLLLAEDVKTPPEVLQLLVERYLGAADPGSGKPSVKVMKALAKNPNLPEEQLAEVSEDYPWDVAQNPALELYRFKDPLLLQFSDELRSLLNLPPRYATVHMPPYVDDVGEEDDITGDEDLLRGPYPEDQDDMEGEG